MVLQPSFVLTKMISHLKRPANAITVEHCVKTGLRDLGYEYETYGAFIHEATGVLASFTHKYLKALAEKGQRIFLKRKS